METFTQLKPLVDNPLYHQQRAKSLSEFDINIIDAPIVEIVKTLTGLPYCFTLQSCCGHFVHDKQKDRLNIEPLPASDNVSTVEYRIAYIALCIQNSGDGRSLMQSLKEITSIDPEYVQFGCAEWFWKRQVDSYALQVGPERHKTRDSITVGFEEALHIEKVRNTVLEKLKNILKSP